MPHVSKVRPVSIESVATPPSGSAFYFNLTLDVVIETMSQKSSV